MYLRTLMTTILIVTTSCQELNLLHYLSQDEESLINCIESSESLKDVKKLHGSEFVNTLAKFAAKELAGKANKSLIFPDEKIVSSELGNKKLELVFQRALIHCSDDYNLKTSSLNPSKASRTARDVRGQVVHPTGSAYVQEDPDDFILLGNTTVRRPNPTTSSTSAVTRPTRKRTFFVLTEDNRGKLVKMNDHPSQHYDSYGSKHMSHDDYYGYDVSDGLNFKIEDEAIGLTEVLSSFMGSKCAQFSA